MDVKIIIHVYLWCTIYIVYVVWYSKAQEIEDLDSVMAQKLIFTSYIKGHLKLNMCLSKKCFL